MRYPSHARFLLVTVSLLPLLALGNCSLTYVCSYPKSPKKGDSYSPMQCAGAVLVCNYINQSKAKIECALLWCAQETHKIWWKKTIGTCLLLFFFWDIFRAWCPCPGSTSCFFIFFAYKSQEIIPRMLYSNTEAGDGCLAWCESPHCLRWDLFIVNMNTLTLLLCKKKPLEGNMGKHVPQTLVLIHTQSLL